MIPAKASSLSKINILVADSDTLMATVLRNSLSRMGFTSVQRVKSGRDALEHIRHQPVDILITEWEIPHLSGIELVNHLRKAEESPNRALATIMLTGRAEEQDVMMARDSGVSEFLVKPYTSKTLFKRIEYLFDQPRGFLISKNFVGPDRRRRQADGKNNRRQTAPKVIASADQALPGNDNMPRIVPAAPTLKRKIGLTDGLSTLITPGLLEEAQKVIDSFQGESLAWVKDDLALLENHCASLAAQPDSETLNQFTLVLLSLKSRAGTFGYHAASAVAYQLYNFLRTCFRPGYPQQGIVLIKHLQVLKVMFAKNVLGHGGAMEHALLHELKTMSLKYS